MRAGGTDQPGADQEEGGEGEAGPGQAHPFNYPPHLLHKRIGVVACPNKNDLSFYLGGIVAGTKLKGLHVYSSVADNHVACRRQEVLACCWSVRSASVTTVWSRTWWPVWEVISSAR